MPPVNSYEDDLTRDLVGGASGLAITAGALGFGSMSMEDQLQDVNQRLRSRSVSPSMAEKAFELVPRSQSRPSSPGGSNQEEKDLRARRLSLLRTSNSPTAVPLHFRKPPTSPNSSRRVSMTSPAQSPISPRPGHRRPNSIEFKNVREIRPLWLVERHSTSKLDVEPEGPLPSLPSSKTSSRSPSVENLREGFDDGEDAVTGFFMAGGDSSYNWNRKPVDLRISTDQLPAEEGDFLNSQQATPTAETYNNNSEQFGPPPIKKEKPKYEFHSPSELLQDPTMYQSMVPELPDSLDRLPSVAGSELGGKEAEMKVKEPLVVESARETDLRDDDQPREQKSGLSSFLAGAGFASVVDAAVSAAVSDHESATKDIHVPDTTSREIQVDPGNQEQAPVSSKPESFGGFGNIVDAAVAAAVSGHTSHDGTDHDRDQPIKADEAHEVEAIAQKGDFSNAGLFAGVVDAAVAAAASETPAEVSQPDLARDVDLREAAVQEQKPEVAEESKIVAEETSSGSSKKQKRKDKKKKKKSKDLDAPLEDDNGEMAAAIVPEVELDSSARHEPAPEVEAERAVSVTEPIDEPAVAEQQPVSEGVEIKHSASEILNDKSLAGESQEVAEDVIRELEGPHSNVETEAVTTSAEHEQTTVGANDQPLHVAADPEDEGSPVAATTSKSSKKKKKNKRKSQSLSESISNETPEPALVGEPQNDSSMAFTEEPKSIDGLVEETPMVEDTSNSMPSETLEKGLGDMATSEENQQNKIEPGVLEPVEKSTADEGEIVMAEQETSVARGTEQNKSLDSPVDEWFDSTETPEVHPTESVGNARDATDNEIQTPEVSQDIIAAPEPIETKMTEEEPVSASSSKKKSKKKKKKGQSLSIDESASQETAQEPSETISPEPESAEGTESEGIQVGDHESQSRGVDAVAESSPTAAEESAPKIDDASVVVVPDSEPTSEVSEAVIKSETVPGQIEEVVEQQISGASVEPVATESLQSYADAIFPEQSIKEIEAAEATSIQEVSEELPSTPSKSKKKKGKKGKRVSWAEGAELAVESEPVTPAEPESPAPEEITPAATSEEPLPAAEESVVSASAEPEPSPVSEVEIPQVEAEMPLSPETVNSAVRSSADVDSNLTSEPSPTTEPSEKGSSTETPPEKQAERVENLDEPPVSLPSESSQLNDSKELPEEEDNQSESASSKTKKKKEKKKDKKKKKAAEASALADEEPSQPSERPLDDAINTVVEETAPEISEQSFAEEKTNISPAETAESQTPEISEAIESTPVEKLIPEQATTDILPADISEPRVAETFEPTEPTPVDQPATEETISATVPEDTLEASTPEVTADEPKFTDIAQEDETQETSKSKKKKDKKKKKAAVAAAAAAAAVTAVLASEQDSSVTEDAKEPAGAVVSDITEKTEDAVDEESTPDDGKEVHAVESVAEPQTVEEPVEDPIQEPFSESAQETSQEPLEKPVGKSIDEPVQEPIQEPMEETKSVDVADDVPTQETSKSKKKKDKKKKKAAEALLPAQMEESADSTPATPTESPTQTESVSQGQQPPDEQKMETLVAAETDQPQSVEVTTEVPAEELKTSEVAADDEWSQETSKSKKKKDKKKKKAGAAFSLDEEPTPSESVLEEAEAKSTEAEAFESQEQPVLVEASKEIKEEQTAELPAEDAKAFDIPEDDVAQETSSKSKKKKDEEKEKAGEALSLVEEPQTPIKEGTAEPVETALPQAQALPLVGQQKSDDVSIDKDMVPESAEPSAETVPTDTQDLPALEEPKQDDASDDKDLVSEMTVPPAEDANPVPVAAEDEWAQEPSSKSKKKKEKKKKKAAEVLSWEEPTPSDKPTDEQPSVDTEPSASQSQGEFPVDKKQDDATEVPDTDNTIPETLGEETKQVDIPDEDSWSQETSKSKKKKDKKKRKSLQLDAAQEEAAPSVAAEEKNDVVEITQEVESTPATSAVVDDTKEADAQTQAVSQGESVPVQIEGAEPDQAENIDDEDSSSKSSKSKKKKNKKNKSKDEPMPWDEEPSVKPLNVEEKVADQPAASEDATKEEASRDLKTPEIADSTRQEKQESEQPLELIAEAEELPANTQVETPEHAKSTELSQPGPSQLHTDDSVSVQPEESADQGLLDATEATEPRAPTDIPPTTDVVKPSPTEVPTSASPDEASNDNEFSQAKSGKKSKKKKKRDSMPWDDKPLEVEDSSAAPVTVEAGDEPALRDSQSEEKQLESAPVEEFQSQKAPLNAEYKDLDSVDANVDAENEDPASAITEPTRQLSAKEKRKEKKKQKRRTLDLADEPSPSVTDKTPEMATLVEPPMSGEQQNEDEVAADDLAPVGKKKGKKNKRQSVSWEEEVIQAVAEEEPKNDETGDSEKNVPPSEQTDLNSGTNDKENELQETPVEVEGKETFQSSEETHTDQKEKDFDWTDNVVSPQVQSQTEESPFPVRSPISDERNDPDQSRPTTIATSVDDSQNHETVIPEAVVEYQPPSAVQQEESTELAAVDIQPVDQEAEDIDWMASKSSKKNKKKKKQKSISAVPDESVIAEEGSSLKTPPEQDDKPDFEPKTIDTDEPKEIHEKPTVIEDSPLVPESVPLQVVDTGRPREILEEPAPLEEIPLVSEPASAREVNPEEEFEPVGPSKKKNKKNKKKSGTWSFEGLGEESVRDQNTEQTPMHSPGDEVKEDMIAAVNDETIQPQDAPLASELVQEKVLEDTTTKDFTMIPEETPNEKSVPQEVPSESKTEPTSEFPSRKLSKKEKRKMKKGKKDFEEEELVAETVEKDAKTVSSGQVPEVAEEKVISEPIIDETPILIEKLAESEPTVEETPAAAKEQKAADMNPAESVPEDDPVTVKEQVADLEPIHSEPVLGETPTNIEEQVVEREVHIAPVPEEPVTRKLSKKEKRKNKKRMSENWPEEEPLQASGNIAPQSDIADPVAAEFPEKNVVNDVVAEGPADAEPQHVHVSLDPFDVPDAEDENPNEPPADFIVENDVAERDPEPKLDADAALLARQLEQEADLAVAASLFGDSAEPEPEQVISRQSSKKQKGKKGKKDKTDKKNAELSADLQDTVLASQTDTVQKEDIVQEEKHDTNPSESVQTSRSWPTVEFDNTLRRTYLGENNVLKDSELEYESSPKISAQDTSSLIDDFRAEERPEETSRSISDNWVADAEEKSQQEHRSHSPSQKEDVDMIISATMAAAGFFPSTVTEPAKNNTSTDIQSTSGTSRDISDSYEHRDGITDVHSKSSIIAIDAPKGESKPNKLAGIFPGLERVKYRKPSPKSQEKQINNTLPVEERTMPAETPVKSLKKMHSSNRELPTSVESTSKDRSSSLLFDSSPSTRLDPTPDTTRRTSSSPIRLQHQTSSGSLHRTQSIHGHHSENAGGSLHRTKSIHGHHIGTERGRQLEDELTPTKRASSRSPQPLLHPDNLEGLSPPRTPLDPIKEHDGPHLPSPSPRLVMGEGPYKLERPDSRSSGRSSRSLRKVNRSISGDLRAAAAQEQFNHDLPSADSDHKKGKAGRQEVGPQPLNRTDFHDDLLHDNNDDVHDERRHLENIPSSSSYDPVTDKGKRPVRGMSDVYVSATDLFVA